MIEKTWRDWGAVVRIGLLGGVVALYLCLAGLVGVFSERALITGIISLGHTLLVLAGLITGLMLALLVLAGSQVNLRAVMLNASPLLYNLLTFNQGVAGLWAPAL